MRGLVNTRYSGATSLLVVLGLGLFMIVLVSGIAALSLREQQQARNTEFSNRALQTAEAGVKAAVQKLSSNPNFTKEGCAPGVDFENVIPNNDLNQEITCIEIKNKFSAYEGFSEQDKATQLIIETPATDKGPNSIQLNWHSNTLDENLASYAYGSNAFYPVVQGYNYAASIEMNFIFWPRNTNFNGSDLTKQMQTATIFFTPGRPDQSQPSNGVDSMCQGQPGVTVSGDYRCVTKSAVSNTGFDLSRALRIPTGTSQDYNMVVRIKPRYEKTHFQFIAYDADGKQIGIKSTRAQIDVTARTGDLYRRIKAEKVIVPTSLESLFDSVLYAGNGSNDNSSRNICKNLVVRADGSLAPTTDAPICSPN